MREEVWVGSNSSTCFSVGQHASQELQTNFTEVEKQQRPHLPACDPVVCSISLWLLLRAEQTKASIFRFFSESRSPFHEHSVVGRALCQSAGSTSRAAEG